LLILSDNLSAGDFIEYSGELIIMRDAAHKKIKELIDSNKELPFDFMDKIIFYAGPAKKPKHSPIGSVGPTTSNRMDEYLEMIYKLGVNATIGKGNRSSFVKDLNKKYKKTYFVCPSGAAASLSQKILNHNILAFADLGTEAIQKIEVEKFPLIVAIDKNGNSIF
jgi:fumarate hydratase subunit beta